MDLVPQEIQKLICTYVDQNTRLKMRLLSTQWHKIINLTHFKFNFARDADVPKIVQLMAHYQSPFSISFPKSCIWQYADFCNEITKLTALTGLELPDFNTMPIGLTFGLGPKITRLAALTNLKTLTRDFTCNTAWLFKCDYIQPSHMYQNFKQLTSLEVLPVIIDRRSGCYREDMNKVLPVIKQNSNIQQAVLDVADKTLKIDQHFADLFMDHKNLTKLHISAKLTTHADCNLFNSLGGLKSFSFEDLADGDREFEPALFGQLTNLEELSHLSVAPLINMDKLVNLTSLRLANKSSFGSEWKKIYQSISTLTKLKVIDLNIYEHEDMDYTFLASLQSLETVSIKRGPSINGDQIQILEHLSSPNLTRLVLNMESSINLSDIERFNSTLLELELTTKDPLTSVNSAALATATNITKLVLLGPVTESDVQVIEKLSKLKDLSFYERNNGPKMSLKNLTKLENITSKVEVDINELAFCTNLTTLKCRFDVQNDTNTDVIASLPLKSIFMHDPLPYNSWFRTIGKIHSLESLVLVGVTDKNMETWDGLTNLTRLVYFDGMVEGTHLSKLTALQRISTNRTVPNTATNLPHVYEATSSYQYFKTVLSV